MEYTTSLQMSMNVQSHLLVIGMPHAPTHLGRTLVVAMRDTLEMEGLALVSCVMAMIIVYFLFVLFKVHR